MINLKHFLLICLMFCFTQNINANETKPNIILILIDDMGWTDLSCQGSKYYQTPNIDRLAKEGMRFTDGYAACAVCSPTRAAVMTGRYPARLGITDWIRARFQGGAMPSDGKNPTGYTTNGKRPLSTPKNALWMETKEITIAEILKPAGYTTCYIGKWHLGMDNHYPDKQGFDFNLGGCDYGQPPSYFDPYINKKLKQGIPTLKPRKTGEYLTDREGDEAVNFIRNNKNKPFFLNLANYAVHTPIQAKKDLTEIYKNRPKSNQKNAAYAAMVHSVDDAVGKILNTLDELKLAENTLIIFTSDNGGLLGPTHNAPLRSGKGFPWEGGIRVPVLARWTGKIKAGITSNLPVISIDYLPTIAEVAGVPIPADRLIDGKSLAKHMLSAGQAKIDRTDLFWHFPHYRGSVVPYSIIRSGDWKLIKFYEGPKFELYNLKNDLSETTNLADKMPDKVNDLDKKLIELVKHTNAKLPK